MIRSEYEANQALSAAAMQAAQLLWGTPTTRHRQPVRRTWWQRLFGF